MDIIDKISRKRTEYRALRKKVAKKRSGMQGLLDEENAINRSRLKLLKKAQIDLKETRMHSSEREELQKELDRAVEACSEKERLRRVKALVDRKNTVSARRAWSAILKDETWPKVEWHRMQQQKEAEKAIAEARNCKAFISRERQEALKQYTAEYNKKHQNG